MVAVLGTEDEYLRLVEKAFPDADIMARGNEITVSGTAEDVGIVDTLGRALLPTLLREFLERSIAQAVGPAIASMLIYLLMAAVLAWRPQGLFPVKHG